jgi:2-polyprenyl-6-methoxyphenol hydroxylase-like FAD-dependent oxidoreductase
VNRDRAVVIGGSMAGLLTARVLSDHFRQVTLIERDRMGTEPESRKGQPQTRHLHGLLANGARIMSGWFPGLLDELKAGGAMVGDSGETMRWYVNGGYRARFHSGLPGATMSRPFLEHLVRRRVRTLPNVTIRDGTGVEGLQTEDGGARVTGVKLAGGGEVVPADLVVDASGRGSASTRWLQALGFPPPPETVLKVDVGYATRLYRRDPNAEGAGDWVFVTPVAPRERRIGGAFPIEGERWIVTLGGWFGDHGPTDEADFLAFAKSLPAPDIHQIASTSEPLSEIMTYKYAANLRRHYERMERFPEGYLVLGDAACSFNPVYGQGMTSAALQAHELDQVLDRAGPSTEPLATRFFRRAAKVIDRPWQLAVGEDFRFPEAVGKRPPGTDLVNRYVSQVHRATHTDPVVGLAFLEVMNLIEPPTRLMTPAVLWRILKSSLSGRSSR